MSFSNPILAGEELIRSAIRSENYVAGSSGWRISRDGDAEFNSLTARGNIVSVGALYTVHILDGEILIENNVSPGQNVLMNYRQFSFGANFMNHYLEVIGQKGIGFRDSAHASGVYFHADFGYLMVADAATGAPETWTQATLAANFTHLGEPLQYRLFPDGTVKLRGGVNYTPGTPASATDVFTLPAGYRPNANRLYVVPHWGSGTPGRILIQTNGLVETYDAPNGQIAFDAIEFSVF